jgi:hypothetical protein
MTTRADCLAGVCPCSRPEYPGDDHRCPADPRSFDEIERERDRELYRPFEEDEGIPVVLRTVR